MNTDIEMLGIHHVSVSASDFDRSKAFYDWVLGYLGMAPALQAKGHPHKDSDGRLCIYAGAGGMFGLWEADESEPGVKFRVYNVGLHHIAFAAGSRESVDRLYDRLKADGVTVLDAPAEYPYVPGFYAVYFADPDGMKLEFAYTPRG